VKCANCKAEIPDNSEFCLKCGTPQGTALKQAELTTEERNRIFQEEKVRHEAQEQIKSDAEKIKATADAEKKKKAQLGCLAVAGMLIAVWVIFQMAGGFGDPPARPFTGQDGKLQNGKKAIPVAVDQDSSDQLIKAQAINDQHAVVQLLLAGKVLSVNDGTKVKVIDSTFTLRQVRILEGSHEGRSGWVPLEFVVK
jgi:zinc-ribbon domain